jgi:hypothetical protein
MEHQKLWIRLRRIKDTAHRVCGTDGNILSRHPTPNLGAELDVVPESAVVI